MKVSVIIPVYNTADYIEDCLKSVCEQTYSNLEIILVNDASSDKSEDMIKAISEEDSRIQLINLPTRQGVGHARNAGIEQASGDYLYFVDSDDVIHEDAIRLLVENINGDRLISGSVSTIKSLDGMHEFVQNETPNVKIRKSPSVFTSRTVQKGLFSRTLINDNQIRFLENVSMYSDYSFIYAVFAREKYTQYTRDSRYFRRKRMDIINNPNILEEASYYDKTVDYLKMYLSIEPTYRENYDMKYLIDMDLMNFYRKTFLLYMREPEQFDEVFTSLQEAFKGLSQKVLRRQNPFVKKEIKTIQKGDIEQFIKLIKLHHFLSDIKNSLTSRTHMKKFVYKRFFLNLPVKEDYVVFESFMGKSYSCNPKAIYEYMINNRPNYKYIWINNGNRLDVQGNAKQVKRYSFKYYYYMARAKYWVFNTRLPKHVKKRSETVYLQTWHGTPLKRLGLDIEEVQMPGTDTGRYKKNFTDESSRWDYLISPNQYSTDIFKRAFDFDNEMLNFGYPRNDVLHQADQGMINRIKAKAGIPVDKKVILYAPTWRDNQFIEKGKYSFELPLDLHKMREELSDEYVVVLRLHYLVASQLELSGYENFAYDLSDFDDIAELYLISDILVTDYSSVFFDYANLNRPILFYTYDLDDYKGKIRGLYFDIETEVPSPLLMTSDEVIDAIKNINQVSANYKEKYEEFYNRFCSWENGKAAENVVNTVFKEEA